MKFTVGVPITGYIVLEVEADTEEEAFEKAWESDKLTLDNVEEWEAHDQVNRGNVSYALMDEIQVLYKEDE